MTQNSCIFCGKSVGEILRGTSVIEYDCERCGAIRLSRSAYDDIPGETWFRDEKNRIALSIVNRNDHEKQAKGLIKEPWTHEKVISIVKNFKPLDPLEKMDHALRIINRQLLYVGYALRILAENDYPYYHCKNNTELNRVLFFLLEEGYIANDPPEMNDPNRPISITPKGYERLREIDKQGRFSDQCFVAMWFTEEMDKVYEKAIKPAIEYYEPGSSKPRFRAINIGKKDHINDINDEIIAEIRRSRFMVCDLTGYRGGVYWEAGFAYGLGLDVIYTCRKDWVKSRIIICKDETGQEVEIAREGIHFDLEHRIRIEWKAEHLDVFYTELNNRIRAVIL